MIYGYIEKILDEFLKIQNKKMKEQILIVKRKPFFNCQLEYLLYNSLKLQYCHVGVWILIYFYCKYNIKNKMTLVKKRLKFLQLKKRSL